MTVQIAMFLLTICAVVTGLITEAIKKAITNKKTSLMAAIVSTVVGVCVPVGYMIISGLTITAQDVVYIIAVVVLTWLCSTLGYDKVIQTIMSIFNNKEVK